MMKLTSQQRAAMKEAQRQGQRRLHVTLTPAQKREARKIAAEEDAMIRRELSVERTTRKRGATVSDALKAAIFSSGLSPDGLAKSARVSPNTIIRFMNGDQSLTLETVNKLAGALELTLTPVNASR